MYLGIRIVIEEIGRWRTLLFGEHDVIKQQLRQGNTNTCGQSKRVDNKFRLYESIVLSTHLYGAETWLITVANGRRLEAAHHRWLRRMLHVSWRDKLPKKTIRERTGQEELGCIIGRRRLTWLGHVARMSKNRRAKKVMNWAPEGAEEDRGRIGRRPSTRTC